MKKIALFLFALFVLMIFADAASAQSIIVTNKVVAVENKVPPPVARDTSYAACLAAAARGETVVLAIGEFSAGPNGYHIAALDGFTPGLWDCFRGSDGRPMIQPHQPPKQMASPLQAAIQGRSVTYCTKTGCYTVTK